MLPPVFFSRDKSGGITDSGCDEKGVVEFGFMSTSTNRNVAVE
jgi:hypothetical protein